jgi:fructokinase
MNVLCFGEILWDFLPDGLFPGGAPFNVAYHLHQQGAHATLLSGVGQDLLGDELLRRLRHWKMDTEAVARHPGLPTGYVRATLGAGGDAQYEIVTSVAWDQIEISEEALRLVVQADALVFGSLAQRSALNRAALERVFTLLPTQAWRVFDVNLRAPYDDLALVRELAAATTVLKLNAAEAARLVAGASVEAPGEEEAHARALASATGCPIVCITAGARGAGLLREDVWHWEKGRDVPVVDTVGSGDAFLATLLTQLLPGRVSGAASLARACRMGEWVATRRGATPPYDDSVPS